MALTIEWTSYGRPAGEALAAAVAVAKRGDPLRPVTVIVPSNHVGVGARRLLASGKLGAVSPTGRGVAAVSFLTVYRLAELLGSRALAATHRRPVSTPVIAAAVRSALRHDAGAFAAVAHHPATESALVDAYRELRDLTPLALGALGEQSRRARDVVRLHRAARAALEGRWYDEEDLIAAAVHEITHAGFAEQVVVHLPQRLSRHGGMLLAALVEATEVAVVAAVTGRARADAEVLASLRRMGALEDLPPAASGPVAPAPRFITCSDADDEVRAAVRRVVAAARDGVALDRIAILHASPDPYGRLVHEHLRAAGIASNGAAVVPLSARAVGRTLLGMFSLPEGRFRREEVFAWLSGAPILSKGRWAPVVAWERASRDAGVAAGRDQWWNNLTHLSDALEAEAEEADADPESADWKAERARNEAERARQLRDFVVGLIDDLDVAAATPRPWSEHAAWAKKHLDTLLGGASRRADWPRQEQVAAEKVERALDRLAALDELEPSATLDVFARTLALELENDLGRVGRLGEGVLVGSIGMGVGVDLDLVVVLGLAEGTFPARVREDSLIPDSEREACEGELALRKQVVDRQQRELLATLAGAREQVLVVPRGDLRRSSERVPSRFALDLASTIAGERWWSDEMLGAEVDWVDHVASFDAGLRRCEFPATAQEHRLRMGIASRSMPDDVAVGAAVVAARRSDAFTRFDGNLSSLAGEIPSPADRTTSPTRLERWTKCPFAYLLEHILNVAEIENPSEELEITPADRGSLIHEVLEHFVAEVLARPAEARPGPDDRWTVADRERLDLLADRVCNQYEARGRTGRPLFWRRARRKILADLHRILDVDEVHRQRERTRPVGVELAFGIRGYELGAVPIALPDGRSVRFRGKADRVDVGDDGRIHVVDYKTGKVDGFENLSAENPDCGGTKLQLPVYGLAARLHQAAPAAPVRSEYWFVSNRAKYRRIGYDVTDDVLERFGRTLGGIVSGIEAGVFAAHPNPDAIGWRVDCAYCDPDGLGIGELRRQWEQKRHDPLLATYANGVEAL